MLPRSLIAAALLGAAAVPALAQDGPPPPPVPPAPPPAAPTAPAPAPAPAAPAKHENKISDAAKAAFDGMAKQLYNPVELGLKELQGKMKMVMQMPGMDESSGMPPMVVDFSIAFKAPEDLNVIASTDNPMLAQAADQLQEQVKHVFKLGVGSAKFGPEEFDADLVEKDGAKSLVLKIFAKNEPKGEMVLSLDANGLPTKGVMKQEDPNMGEVSIEIGFTFVKEGEKYRLEKQVVQHPMMPEPLSTVVTFQEAGGFKVPSAIDTTGGMGMTFTFRYTELTVNGKKVELPAEKKPEPAPEKPATPTTPPAPPAPMPPAPPPEGPK
jgi:hypothetical protein